MPFEFVRHPRLPEVIHVKPRVFGDARGWFTETYKRSDFAAHGIPHDFHQDNHSYSAEAGVLRGLHLQLEPHAQGKLVRCVRGVILDVAVDVRRGSPTYGQWAGVELSAKRQDELWIPPGFAHGFVTREPHCEVAYKTTREYAPAHERTIRWDDPALAIAWGVGKPILAPRDATAPTLAELGDLFTFEGPR
jgi:dTDP-4-dehydrorhamnose 3,5-epimerase